MPFCYALVNHFKLVLNSYFRTRNSHKILCSVHISFLYLVKTFTFFHKKYYNRPTLHKYFLSFHRLSCPKVNYKPEFTAILFSLLISTRNSSMLVVFKHIINSTKYAATQSKVNNLIYPLHLIFLFHRQNTIKGLDENPDLHGDSV